MSQANEQFKLFVSDYGMFFVLLVLIVFFSFSTMQDISAEGEEGGEQLIEQLSKLDQKKAKIILVTRQSSDDMALSAVVEEGLKTHKILLLAKVNGSPIDLNEKLTSLKKTGQVPTHIVASASVAKWSLVKESGIQVLEPEVAYRSLFLSDDNITGILDKVVVYAIIAVGMTLVILLGGIDLSVGALIAFSGVVAGYLIRDVAGSYEASNTGIVLGCLGAIGACALVGFFTGVMVARFAVPSFIVTLAIMLSAQGVSFMISDSQTIYQVPDKVNWLDQGAIAGMPVPFLMVIFLYILGHVLMSHTKLGRYIYAVGGNEEAARLSGVPVKRVKIFVFTLTAALAGLAGVLTFSRLGSGDPKVGVMEELYVIACVVVGGTSLAGGKGKILATLIGTLIIAVMMNGMNLHDLDSHPQKIVLGMIILGGVFLDMIKNKKMGAN
jgi:ribose transport system permease protein